MIYEVLFVIWAVLVASLLLMWLVVHIKWAIEDWFDDKSWQIYLDSQSNEPRPRP